MPGASPSPVAVSPATSAEGPSGKNLPWDAQRATIVDLYMTQNKTLKEVMAIMHQCHGFCASEKMYKMRFKRWNLKKNNSVEAVVEIMRLQKERETQGKLSTFSVAGRPWSEKRYQQYLRRVNPERLRREEERGRATERQLGIVVRTPSPPMSPCRVIRAPECLQVPEEMFLTIRNLYVGSIEGQLWAKHAQQEQEWEPEVIRLRNDLGQLMHFYRRGHHELAIAALRRSLDRLSTTIFRFNHPALLCQLLTAILGAFHDDESLDAPSPEKEIGMLLHTMRESSDIYRGPNDPFRGVWERILPLDRSTRGSVVVRAIKLIVDQLRMTRRSLPSSPEALKLPVEQKRLIHSAFLLGDDDPDACYWAEYPLRRVVAQFRRVERYWTSNEWTQPPRYVVESTRSFGDGDTVVMAYYHAMTAQMTRNKEFYTSTIRHYQDALRMYEYMYGRYNINTINVLCVLELMLRTIGHGDALKVREDINRRCQVSDREIRRLSCRSIKEEIKEER